MKNLLIAALFVLGSAQHSLLSLTVSQNPVDDTELSLIDDMCGGGPELGLEIPDSEEQTSFKNSTPDYKSGLNRELTALPFRSKNAATAGKKQSFSLFKTNPVLFSLGNSPFYVRTSGPLKNRGPPARSRFLFK